MKMSSVMTSFRGIMLLALLLSFGSTAWSQETFEFDEPMYSEPKIFQPPLVHRFPNGLIPLWSQALERNEAELQRQAALAVRRAHSLGMEGLEVTITQLRKNFENQKDGPARIATARALLELEDKPSYDKILAACRNGRIEFSVQIEPELGRLGHLPIRQLWRDRLKSSDPSIARMTLAIEGLAAVGDTNAGALLRAIVDSRTTSAGMKLSAARAMGRLGVAYDASRLTRLAAPSATFTQRYMAAAIAVASEASGLQALRQLSEDKQTAIARLALQRLAAHDAKLLAPMAKSLAVSRDPEARKFAAQGWGAVPSMDAIVGLSGMLGDRNTGVRNTARGLLVQLAKDDKWKAPVVEEIGRQLQAARWQALEQSTILAGQLNARQYAEDIIPFLEHRESEVYIAAAWTLRKLRSKEALPAMRKRVNRIRYDGVKDNFNRLDDQSSLIFQAFGIMYYKEGMEILEEYISNKNLAHRVRAAAVWASGRIAAHHKDGELINALAYKFVERMNDMATMPVEDPIVKRFSALALARFKLPSTVKVVKGWYYKSGEGTMFHECCRWAYEQMTEDRLDKAKPRIKVISGWFIQPTG